MHAAGSCSPCSCHAHAGGALQSEPLCCAACAVPARRLPFFHVEVPTSHSHGQPATAGRRLKSATFCTCTACSALHCLNGATCAGSCSSCACMYDVISTPAGKLVSKLGGQASLPACLPPNTQVLQMAPSALQVGMAESISDGTCQNRRSCMHLLLALPLVFPLRLSSMQAAGQTGCCNTCWTVAPVLQRSRHWLALL